jgi:5-methylthioadenosine/S-adenosylhomocysteine deaminase
MLDVKQCFENASQGKPSWCPSKWGSTATSLKCEMNKYGETKALVAGTTSMIGLIGTINNCVGSLARSLGTSYSNLDEHNVQSSALVPSNASSANNVCKNFENGTTKAYVIHTGEGTDALAKGEFEKLRNLTTPPGCLLAPQTVITHGNAFNEVEFKEMGEKGMKLVWSPRSNISLYGDTPISTTNIPLARSFGITVALGPDWSMGGSVNMLDEMRFADAWDNKHWGNKLSPQDLFEMATANAAKALALDNQIGAIKVGLYADLFVFGGNVAAPYDALMATYPSTVRLVMVGGRVLYGDPQLKASALNAGSCEDIQVCGVPKFLCVAEANSTNKLDQKFDDIKTVLEEGLLEVDNIPVATKGHSYTFAPLAPLTTCP